MPVGALSSSNRSQLGYKLEGVYPLNFGVIQGGNGAKLNMLSETLNHDIKTVASKTIRSDRQVPDIVQVGASSAGGFAFEAQYKEFDPFLLGVLQANDWTAYGTNGVSAALPAITTISTVTSVTTITFTTATAGADILTGLQKGQWFTLKPPVAAAQAVKDYFLGRAFRVTLTGAAPTSTVLVLDASTPIDTAIAGTAMAAGAIISSSRAANGNVMKSYTLEVGHADMTPAVYRQYTGMIPSKVDYKLVDGDIVTGSFEFMGKSMTKPMPNTTCLGVPAEPQTFTPANATRGVFDIIEGGVSISASTFIKTMDFSIDNSLRMQTAVGVFGSAGIGAGTMQIMGKLGVYFADASLYNKFLNGAASSLSLPLLDVDGNGYVYYFPRIKYTSAKVNVGGQDQDNELAMDFQALPDTTVGSPTLGLSVVVYRVGA